MKSMKRNHRILAVLLAVMMMFTCIPFSGYAVGAETVATIGTVEYSTVGEFTTAWSGITGTESVTLYADIDLGTSYLNVGSGKTITLNLNGKKLTSSASYTIRLYGGHLIVNDEVGTGVIENTKVASTYSQTYGIYANKSGSALDFNSGNIVSKKYGFAAGAAGTYNINGGTLNGASYSVSVTTSGAVVNINNGYFVGATYNSSGTLNIYDGYFTAMGSGTYSTEKDKDFVACSVEHNEVTYNYTIGTLTEDISDVKIGDDLYLSFARAYSSTTSGTITLLKNATSSVYISKDVTVEGDYTLTTASSIAGGTFNCDVVTSSSISKGTFNGNLVSTGAITGGTFNGNVSADDGKISGGLFKNKPDTASIAANYIAVAKDEMYQVILDPSACEAKIGDVYYLTLENAFSSGNGKTIVLLKNIDRSVVLDKFSSEVYTLDLNDHNIAVSTGTALKIGGCTLTITDTVGEGEISGDVAVCVGDCGRARATTLVVNNGVFTGDDNSLKVTKNSTKTSSVTVNNGEFNGAVTVTKTGDNFDGTIRLNDGLFSVDPSTIGNATYPDGYGPKLTKSGKYKIAEVTYDVTIGTVENGTVTVDKTTAPANATITITATPNADYKVDEYFVDGEAIDGNTFTLTKNCTVTATFVKKQYVVKNTNSGVKYESISEAFEDAEEGDVIKLIRSINTSENISIDSSVNTVFDLGGYTVYLTDGATINITGYITVKNGTVNGSSNYAIYTNMYHPDDFSWEMSEITFDRINVNAGVNLLKTNATFKNCKIDASTRKYYAIYVEDAGDILVESGTYIGGASGKVICQTAGTSIIAKGGKFSNEIGTDNMPSGYSCVLKDEMYVVGIPVAQVGENEYFTLGEAFEAAKAGGTVVLLMDYAGDASGATDFGFNYYPTGDVVFDLNGYTWDLTNKGPAIRLYSGKLTIKSSVEGGKILNGCTHSMIQTDAGTEFVLESGSIVSETSTSGISVGGTITINGGSVQFVSMTDTATAFTMNDGEITSHLSLSYDGSATYTVNGGTIANICTANSEDVNDTVVINDGHVVWLQNSGSTTVNGGTVDNINGGAVINGGKIGDLYYNNISEEDWLADDTRLCYRAGTYTLNGGYFKSNAYITDDVARSLQEDVPAGYKIIESTEYPGYGYTIGAYSVAPIIIDKDVNVVEKDGSSSTSKKASQVTDDKVKEVIEEIKNDMKDVITEDKTNVNEVVTSENDNEISQLKIELKDVVVTKPQVSSATVTTNSIKYDVKPVFIVTDNQGNKSEKTVTNDELAVMLQKAGKKAITFALIVPSTMTGDYVTVLHYPNGSATPDWSRDYKVLTDGTKRYVEISASSFSEFEILYTTAKTYKARNVDTDAYYVTLAEALSAAKSDETVELLADIDDELTVIVKAGITLDINGNDIVNALIIYVKGDLIDSSETKGIISAETYSISNSTTYTPIYDASREGYSLYLLKVNVLWNSTNNCVIFALDKTVANDIILASGENKRIKAVVTLNWKESQANVTHSFELTDELLANYIKSNNKSALQTTFYGFKDVAVSSITGYASFVITGEDDGTVIKTLSSVTFTAV